MCFDVLLPKLVNKDAPVCSVAAAIIVLYADHAVRRLILDGLAREGHDAVGACDFVEASEWTTIYPDSISVMITDMSLSAMSGPEAADWNSVRHLDLRVLFTANHAVDPEIMRYWMNQGARFLDKPFRLDELLRIVNEMMLPARG
jgi:DNA-binding NtrC family response regulator